ncbi:putative (di)nucleoside polyphosphate hydrolase [Roseimicrobium gellanilyticum]|uniref:Putative (Di)nucleoside polyphosphate hydrolase n=1 Tax=Roseimicrobium gellanilyticum TaxID=748857 RepID=A0A366HMP9_9BACT|nr:RNA pyrophosphohydrolase [Roseimicrobium gellanilyticum]RBP44417.1 putative (di)nucleoside polyphosphate hydrolase [Roseimicrobium gellanilyticum]
MPVPPQDVTVEQPVPSEGTTAGRGVPSSAPILYRPNVAAIILNMENNILVAQRAGLKGAWQFPQGGVDMGEGWDEALYREVEEEIGLKPENIQILDRKGGYRYEFPKGRLKYGVYAGQEQVYYLCRFLGRDSDVNLNTAHREFDKWKWIRPEKFDMSWVPRFKRDVYLRVFRDFFGMEK